MSHPVPHGVLLVNLGTPDAPTTPAVRRYLHEFLSDPRVVDIPAAARWMLVNLVILPTRPARSAEAYRKVWMPEGSPLLFHSRALTEAVQQGLGAGYAVELGMRYGNPSLPDALARLRAKGARSLTVVPLYPQYAASSTGSSLERVYEVVAKLWNIPALQVVPPFFDDAQFLDAFAKVARPVLAEARPDHVLFSFHGLPERQVQKSDGSGAHCLKSPTCCEVSVPANAWCYRHQCYVTARGIAERLGIASSEMTVSFQSRLGRTPWVKPYTDVLLPELAQRGVKRIAVLCPSFVADCLETLEEISIRAKDTFLAAGGEALTLVPSLNAEPLWVAAVADWVRRSGPSGAPGTAVPV